MDFEDRLPPVRFLVHDRDVKFIATFDEVFRSCRAEVILTPIRAPTANAAAERFVQTVRSECLDWVLVRGRRHLDHVLRIYASHYNCRRPHRSLALVAPLAEVRDPVLLVPGKVRRRDVLGGLIHEYYPAAA